MSNFFMCKNGLMVEITIDEDADYSATVTGPDREKLGEISFHLYDDDGGYLKLTWMHLEGNGARWIRQGIGRETLLRVKKASGYAIAAGSNDGHRQNDGSHFTGDAPSFVAKMREEGIIEEQPV